MTTIFRVWAQIEQIDDEPEKFTNQGLPDPLGDFETLEEAQEFLRSLPGWDSDGSDHVKRDSPYRKRVIRRATKR